MTKINKNILLLGIVSLLTDISSEMIFPILPLFLDQFLRASKFEIGLIEGLAQFTASFLKVVSGVISDRIGRRKPLVVLGYTLSALSKPLFFFAGSWKDVLFIRTLERTGKGIRTSPRDALISAYSSKEKSGRAFGIHRGMDTLGAVIGTSATIFLLFFLGETESTFRLIFLVSFIPAFLAVVVLVFFVKEKPVHISEDHRQYINIKDLPDKFFVFLFFQVGFTVFSMNFAILLLKANYSGVSAGFIPAVYLLFNVVYAFFSYPAGLFSDKLGKGVTLSASYMLFSITALMFISNQYYWAVAGFVFYGLFMALNEVSSRAVVSDIVPENLKGTAYGIYHTLMGIAGFVSSSTAGFLWDWAGAELPFIIGALAGIMFSTAYILYQKKL